MTQTARLVLADCRRALGELPDPPTEAWRRRWITLVVLLRAVGHVLDKVDGERGHPAMCQAVDRAWREVERTKPDVFAFIESERNGILKTYLFTATQSVTIQVHGEVISHTGCGAGATFAPPAVVAAYSARIATGAFAGCAPKDVARKAVTWWTEYLDGVDREAARIRAA